MGAPFLEIRNCSINFGGVKALQNVDFSIEAGQAYCLMGENGSGKSTLIKIISGVYTATSGEMILDGKHYTNITPKQAIEAGVQVIYQDFSVFPNLTVAENIAISGIMSGKKKTVDRKKMREVAAEALARINVDLPLDKRVEELPVAGKQLVAIARGIAQDAKLIIMDEPTTALTHKEILALYEIIDNLKKKGIALIFVSHKLEEVMQISERIAILRNGQKVLDDSIENFDKDSVAYYMTGREVPDVPYELVEVPEGTAPILELEGLTMKDKFEDITLSLYPKEVLGITGQLGCGRTELAQALFGIGEYTGTVKLNGEVVEIKTVQDALRLKIGYVPEDRLSEGLFLTRSLSDNLAAASIDDLADGIRLDYKKVEDTGRQWVEDLKIVIGDILDPASSLSGGNQQRIVLAKWLATNPRLLILNCPTVGVDVGSKSQIHEIVKDLARKGIGVIVISDDIGEVMSLCSRVLVMKKGRIVRQTNRTEMTVSQLEDYLTKEE
ncbi:MAG: sugar ABC transporter ATP-binding protein [Oscillospiraceae bacterium]|nr:sugar ABC transporter ATP-binding protein [Oscillospiraceae bacterium]